MAITPSLTSKAAPKGAAFLFAGRELRDVLPVRQPKAHGARRAYNVDEGDRALQFVMAGLMEEVAETDDSGSFTNKVHCQSRRRGSEYTNDRIQFLSAALKIGAGHGEVGATERCGGDEQNAILPVEELVLGAWDRLREGDRRHGLNRRNGRIWKRGGCK